MQSLNVLNQQVLSFVSASTTTVIHHALCVLFQMTEFSFTPEQQRRPIFSFIRNEVYQSTANMIVSHMFEMDLVIDGEQMAEDFLIFDALIHYYEDIQQSDSFIWSLVDKFGEDFGNRVFEYWIERDKRKKFFGHPDRFHEMVLNFLQKYPQILWILLVQLKLNYEAAKILLNLAFLDNFRSQRLEHLRLAKINAKTAIMESGTEVRQGALDIIKKANFWTKIIEMQEDLLKDSGIEDDGVYYSFKELIERMIQKKGDFQETAFSLITEFRNFCTPEEYNEINILKWKWLLELEDWHEISVKMGEKFTLASSQIPKLIEESDFGRMFMNELTGRGTKECDRIRRDAAEAASLLRRNSGPFYYGSCSDAIFSTIDEFILN